MFLEFEQYLKQNSENKDILLNKAILRSRILFRIQENSAVS
jgi:hypothetical protein